MWAVMIPKKPSFDRDLISINEVSKITPACVFLGRYRRRHLRVDYRIDLYDSESVARVAYKDLRATLGVTEEEDLFKQWSAATDRRRAAMREFSGKPSRVVVPDTWYGEGV